MWTALLLTACGLLIVRAAWSGYRKGAVAHLVFLGVLAVCYTTAGLIALSGTTFAALGFVPKLIQPYALAGAVAATLFVTLSLLAAWFLRRLDRGAVERARADGVEAPDRHTLTNSPANRRWGVVIGAMEGTVLAAMLFFAVHYLSLWTLASDALMEAQRPASSGTQAASVPPPDPTPFHGVLRAIGKDLQRSPVARAVDVVAPIKTRQVEMMGRLTKLAADERKLDKLKDSKAVRELMHHPRIVALSHDPEIARALREKRWADLMNNPQVLGLARDRGFLEQVRQLDLERLIAELAPEESMSGVADAQTRVGEGVPEMR